MIWILLHQTWFHFRCTKLVFHSAVFAKSVQNTVGHIPSFGPHLDYCFVAWHLSHRTRSPILLKPHFDLTMTTALWHLSHRTRGPLSLKLHFAQPVIRMARTNEDQHSLITGNEFRSDCTQYQILTETLTFFDHHLTADMQYRFDGTTPPPYQKIPLWPPFDYQSLTSVWFGLHSEIDTKACQFGRKSFWLRNKTIHISATCMDHNNCLHEHYKHLFTWKIDQNSFWQHHILERHMRSKI